MKHTLLVFSLALCALTMSAAPKMKTTIDRIDPTDWCVGLKNPSVQLMVYGQNIRHVDDVTIDYQGVTIDSTVYDITVTVADNGAGQLAASFDGVDGEDKVDFVNQYRDRPAGAIKPI